MSRDERQVSPQKAGEDAPPCADEAARVALAIQASGREDVHRDLITILRRLRDLETCLADAERRASEAERDLAFYKDREKHFAKLLRVADGGKYRNDWDGALEMILKERDALRTRLATVTEALRRLGHAYCAGLNRTVPCDGDDHNSECEDARAALSSDPPAPRDGCESCGGTKGGVPGNENIVNGKVICDYCHAELPSDPDTGGGS